MGKNQFMVMRRHIERMVGNYKKVLEECSINDKLHSETVYRMAHPFLYGNFTLAVIGDMSSGKSTFINTLTGMNLLPTGHFQTTSTITYIEHGAKTSMMVKFADDHEERFEGVNIKTFLRDLVAVPEVYQNLPINDINHLISAGDSLEDILAKKDGIEENTHVKSDTTLWKKYIKEHPQSKIADEVHIYCHLPKEMHGWKIVDTPGVGAIGGIQESTKRLFASRDEDGNKLIDAIIFLKRGDSNIEGEADVTFFENVFSQLTNEAKERLFFILTHATAEKFRLHREETLLKAHQLYGQKYNIHSSRLTQIDSLMARLHDDILSQGLSAVELDPLESSPIEGWNEKEFEMMLNLIIPLKKELKTRKLSINDENLLMLMEEWGNFVTLKQIINQFVREVKEQSFQKICTLIREDYLLMMEKYKKEIAILKGGQSKIDSERTLLKQKRVEYNKVLNKLSQMGAIQPLLEKFKFVDEVLATFSQKKSIDEVRVTYQNLMEEVTSLERRIFDELEDEFKAFCNEYDPKDILLKQIDFKALEDKAQNISTTRTPVYKTETYKTGGWSSKTETKQVYVRTDVNVDKGKKLREFVAYVLGEARTIVTSFRDQLNEKINHLCALVDKEIKDKLAAQEVRLSELEKQLDNKVQEEAIKQSKMSIITENLELINKQNDDNDNE